MKSFNFVHLHRAFHHAIKPVTAVVVARGHDRLISASS